MRFSFPYQTVVDLILQSKFSAYPNFLKELVKKSEISDVTKFEEFLNSELENTSTQSQEGAEYFIFIAKQALTHYLRRRDVERFQHAVDLTRHRMTALKNLSSVSINLGSWDQYIRLMQVAFQRLTRHIPLERFEAHMDKLDWAGFEPSIISEVSSILGYVYLFEEEADQTVKSRLWLQKSIRENDFEHNLGNYLALALHFLSEGQPDSVSQVRNIIDQLKDGKGQISSADVRRLFDAAIFELEAHALSRTFENFDTPETRLERSQQELRDLESRYRRTIQDHAFPQMVQASIEAMIARLYSDLFAMTGDTLEQAGFARDAVRYIDKSIERSESVNDAFHAMSFRLLRVELSVANLAPVTEKEVREVMQFYKKGNDYPTYIRSVRAYANLLSANKAPQKSYDLIMDVIKVGQKKIEDEGGFYLIYAGLKLANDLFLVETEAPGVSWMVHQLHSFFEQIKRTIDELDPHLDRIGLSLIEQFRGQYHRLEPASHFNIKVYFSYQLYQLKMMRIGAIIHKDELSQRLGEKLIASLENENNPLSFISANWEDYKEVPNSVRNKTLNKCINISKGDLPLAAEHLDFSYRNLRSYITFKEVNRLGFFLDMQQTNNRQLEQGIRYMFFDLYKRGTIFEVVFDMPRFLVKYAASGFYSLDLEQELNIKGTTAKKYIKIMIDIKLIRQDRTTGRKHYYRLMRENVMKRLGKDQNTLIKPQT